MFDIKDSRRQQFMLDGSFARCGYDWWWHSLTAINERTKEEKPFFIEYFTCNPALGSDHPIFGQLAENQEKHIKPSYLMVKAGSWGKDHKQLHRFFAWNDVTLQKGVPFSIKAKDCYIDDSHIKGSITIPKEEVSKHPEWMCDDGKMSWDLQIEKINAFHVGYGAGGLFRKLKAFEMYWHAEGMKSRYSGTITWNDEVYQVIPEKSFGYADKNWGKDFTSPWVWLSSNDLVSLKTGNRLEDSVFDIGGGRPKVFGIALNRKLLGVMRYEGKQYEYNFAKFWMGVKTVFDYVETSDEIIWHVTQSNFHSLMKTEIHCHKEDMLLVNYEAPNGKKKHNKLWNGGNGYGTVWLYEKKHGQQVLIDEIQVGHVGCEYGEYNQ